MVNAAAGDGSSLPDYRPAQQVSGIIRIWGNDNMAALLKQWESGFRKYHSQSQFADTLKGTGSGIYGLGARVADLAAMARPIKPFERSGTYERSWTYPG